MKVASAQTLVIGGDPAGNLERALSAVADAKRLGADFVVLPECSNFGWTDPSSLAAAVSLDDDPFVLGLRAAAKTNEIYIAVGFVERIGTDLFNSAVLIEPAGQIVIHHQKVNELGFAKEMYSTGSSVSTAETPFGKIGLMICADALEASDQVIERLLDKGAQVILSPSAWAVPPEHDNLETPYGSLWVNAYRRGLGNSRAWIVAASNVGKISHGVWKDHLCIGNSIAIGPSDKDIVISPFGPEASHLEIIEIPQDF
jgi:predicted amidohydrolase